MRSRQVDGRCDVYPWCPGEVRPAARHDNIRDKAVNDRLQVVGLPCSCCIFGWHSTFTPLDCGSGHCEVDVMASAFETLPKCPSANARTGGWNVPHRKNIGAYDQHLLR